MTPEEREERRRQAIRSLEQEKQDIDAQLAQAEEHRAALEAALLRAYHQPLSNDICLSCWINHGDKVVLKNVPENPPLGMYDRFVCSQCGYEESREA